MGGKTGVALMSVECCTGGPLYQIGGDVHVVAAVVECGRLLEEIPGNQ